MPIDDNEAPKGNLFYKGSDGNWHPINEACIGFEASINMSEEIEAMFWAQMEGLEIVKGE